jgi:hypothetical protein
MCRFPRIHAALPARGSESASRRRCYTLAQRGREARGRRRRARAVPRGCNSRMWESGVGDAARGSNPTRSVRRAPALAQRRREASGRERRARAAPRTSARKRTRHAAAVTHSRCVRRSVRAPAKSASGPQILARGGSVVDVAIAVNAVLGTEVEPGFNALFRYYLPRNILFASCPRQMRHENAQGVTLGGVPATVTTS